MRTKPGWLKFPQTIPEIHDDKICPNALFRNIFEFCFSKMSWSNCIRGLELCSFLDFRFDFLRPLASKSMVRLFMQMPRVCHLAGPVVVVRTLEHRESPWLGRWSCIKIHKWIEEKKQSQVESCYIHHDSIIFYEIWNDMKCILSQHQLQLMFLLLLSLSPSLQLVLSATWQPIEDLLAASFPDPGLMA